MHALLKLMASIAIALCACTTARCQESEQVPSGVVYLAAERVAASESTPPQKFELEDLEAMALRQHPALVEANAKINASRGAAYQAGRPNNPTVGYVANEFGNDGSAGQHGGFIGQTIRRGGKRQLDQAIACQEVQRLTQEYEATRWGILNQVRQSFYSLLVMQRRIEIYEYLLQVNRQASKLQSNLADAGYILELDATMSRVDSAKVENTLIGMRAKLTSQRRELAATIGSPDLVLGRLAGDIRLRVPQLTFEEVRQLVVTANPILSATAAEIQRERFALSRAQVEPIPDVNVQIAVQYDYGTDDTFPSIQVGLPLPVWDKNRGAVYQAASNVSSSVAKYERQRLDLQRQLSGIYGEYHSAALRANQYADKILPDAQSAVRSAKKLYEATEIKLDRLIEIQRYAAITDLEYLDASDKAWRAYQRMMSLLAKLEE